MLGFRRVRSELFGTQRLCDSVKISKKETAEGPLRKVKGAGVELVVL